MNPNPRTLAELRRATFPDGSLDSRSAALALIDGKDPYIQIKGYPQRTRPAPCADCATWDGMYAPIAACGYRHLYPAERIEAARRWTCHNGGRCEGAALILLGDPDLAQGAIP